jgi:hypothetical protein
MLLVGVGLVRRALYKGPDRRVAGGIAARRRSRALPRSAVRWFGHFWPTPYLVKLVQPAPLANGLTELGGDWLGMLPIVALAGSRSSARRCGTSPGSSCRSRFPPCLLAKAGGDWMGHGRWILPGFLASLSGLAASRHPPRARPRAGRTRSSCPTALVCSDALLYGGLRLRTCRIRSSRRTCRRRRSATLTWLVEHAPEGALVQLDDVGMVSLIPDIGILDNYGLVDRAMALARRVGITRKVEARYTGEHPLDCIRSISRSVPSIRRRSRSARPRSTVPGGAPERIRLERLVVPRADLSRSDRLQGTGGAALGGAVREGAGPALSPPAVRALAGRGGRLGRRGRS